MNRPIVLAWGKPCSPHEPYHGGTMGSPVCPLLLKSHARPAGGSTRRSLAPPNKIVGRPQPTCAAENVFPTKRSQGAFRRSACLSPGKGVEFRGRASAELGVRT